MYDNDWAIDYVDWYLMAIASAGDIMYVGISTSSSVPPYNRHIKDLSVQMENRQKIVRIGQNSGFRNVPTPPARHGCEPDQASLGNDLGHAAY